MEKTHHFSTINLEHCKKIRKGYLPAWAGMTCFMLLLCVVSMILPKNAYAIPSYTRQTGFTCDEYHLAYPNLTPLDREFKFHGYTMSSTKSVKSDAASDTTPLLNFNRHPPAVEGGRG